MTDIIGWDVGNWSQALALWDSKVGWDRVQTCLELGGREGGLSLWMALKGKNVTCSDVIDVERMSSDHHRKYGVEQFIQYQNIDATNIPYENQFDIVAFKSVLGAIGGIGGRPAQQTAIDQIFKALKPGGKLLFAENLSASAVHALARRKFARWSKAWRYVSVSDVREFLHAFGRVELHTTGVVGTFGRTERQRQLLAGVDRAFLNWVTPARWQYIVYGIAEKPAD